MRPNDSRSLFQRHGNGVIYKEQGKHCQVTATKDSTNNTEFSRNRNVSKIIQSEFYATGIFAKYPLEEGGNIGLCCNYKSEIHDRMLCLTYYLLFIEIHKKKQNGKWPLKITVQDLNLSCHVTIKAAEFYSSITTHCVTDGCVEYKLYIADCKRNRTTSTRPR